VNIENDDIYNKEKSTFKHMKKKINTQRQKQALYESIMR
jgi:hypothetical protein